MSRATALIRILGLALVVVLTGLVGHALTVATIASDLPEYFPGETVTLTGAGWTPGETVTIVLHRDPFVQPDTVLTSVADASGTITNTSFTPAPDRPRRDLLRDGHGIAVRRAGHRHLQGQERRPGPAPSPRTGTPPATGTRRRAHRQRGRHDSGRRPSPLSRHQLDRVRPQCDAQAGSRRAANPDGLGRHV